MRNAGVVLLLNHDIHFGRFPANNGCFTGWSPHIAAKHAAGLNHAVAGNEKRHRVAANGRAHRPRGFGMVDLLSDAAVGAQVTHRDFQQRFPYFQLELGAFEVQLYLGQLAPVMAENLQGVLLENIGRGENRALGNCCCKAAKATCSSSANAM